MAIDTPMRKQREPAVAKSSHEQHRNMAPSVLERELGALEDALRAARTVCDQTRERTAAKLAQLTVS